MADATCTSAALRPRSLFLAFSATPAPALRSTRPYGRPMAVPTARAPLVGPRRQLGVLALCLLLAAASAPGPGRLVGAARTALDGLAVQEVALSDGLDLADLPAMDPDLAQVLDPRPLPAGQLEARPRRAPIQPFQYDMRAEESLLDVAARFGVPISALMWNNGIETAEQDVAGQRLTLLPMSGVLHLVRPGETPREVAARYGAPVAALLDANALDDPDAPLGDGVLIVPHGAVPTPTATLFPLPLPTALIGEPGPGPRGAATPVVEPAIAPTQVPIRALHTALIGAAMARPWDELPRPAGATAAQRDFILSLAAGATESQRLLGVPASVTLAQAILESDWGRSRLARDGKNLFGIKAHTRPGTAGVYRAGTWEVFGGANVVTTEAFKAYKTVVDSIVDHGHWFHEQPRYAGALRVRDDPRAFVRAIAEAGYATDPAYASKLITLMDRFELYAYDLEPPAPPPEE